jgi:hypothetical protein
VSEWQLHEGPCTTKWQNGTMSYRIKHPELKYNRYIYFKIFAKNDMQLQVRLNILMKNDTNMHFFFGEE